jgi:hypothetical protein
LAMHNIKEDPGVGDTGAQQKDRSTQRDLHTENTSESKPTPDKAEAARYLKLARYVENIEDSASNRWLGIQEEVSNPPQCRCIASQWAMWRWLTDETGYCGLGGEP